MSLASDQERRASCARAADRTPRLPVVDAPPTMLEGLMLMLLSVGVDVPLGSTVRLPFAELPL